MYVIQVTGKGGGGESISVRVHVTLVFHTRISRNAVWSRLTYALDSASLWNHFVTCSFMVYLATLSRLRRQIKQWLENDKLEYMWKELVGGRTPLYRPGQALRVPGGWVSQILRQSAHESGKFISPTHRPPLPPGNIPGTYFYLRLSRPQGHSAAGRILSMKIFSDTIGSRTRDLPACNSAGRKETSPNFRYPSGIWFEGPVSRSRLKLNTPAYRSQASPLRLNVLVHGHGTLVIKNRTVS
jgi:hypothetical protein